MLSSKRRPFCLVLFVLDDADPKSGLTTGSRKWTLSESECILLWNKTALMHIAAIMI